MSFFHILRVFFMKHDFFQFLLYISAFLTHDNHEKFGSHEASLDHAPISFLGSIGHHDAIKAPFWKNQQVIIFSLRKIITHSYLA